MEGRLEYFAHNPGDEARSRDFRDELFLGDDVSCAGFAADTDTRTDTLTDAL